MIDLLSIVPGWGKALALGLLAAALVGYGYHKGATAVKTEWLAADAARLKVEQAAIAQRLADNVKLEAKQKADNAAIAKVKDEELDKVRADLFLTQRLRQPAFCSGVASAAKAESPASGNSTDTASGLVPEQVGRDIQALIEKTEEVAATGRACQAFLAANDFVP